MKTPLLLLVSIALLQGACAPDPKSMKGVALPEGDIEAGKLAFTELKCHRCHSVDGVDLPRLADGWQQRLELGGKIYRVKNYGELVSSIANPDHIISDDYKQRLGEFGKYLEVSPMPTFADEMTVQELLNLVTFLHSRYQQLEPDYNYEFLLLPAVR